jgi:hypothetical protein
MQTVSNTKRLDKIVKINPYLTNFGKIDYTSLLISILFTFFILLNINITITLLLLQDNYNLNTWYSIGTQLEKMNVKIAEWVFFNSIGWVNVIKDSIAEWLQLGNIKDIIPSKEIYLSTQGLILVIITAILSVIKYTLTIMTSYYQKTILSEANLTNIYIPSIFILRFMNRYKNKMVSVKLIRELKNERNLTDKEREESIKNNIFNCFDTEKSILIVNKRFFLYTYTNYYLIDKEEKKELKEIKNKHINKKEDVNFFDKKEEIILDNQITEEELLKEIENEFNKDIDNLVELETKDIIKEQKEREDNLIKLHKEKEAELKRKLNNEKNKVNYHKKKRLGGK